MYLQPWQPRHLLMHSVTEACQPDCRARMLRRSAPLEGQQIQHPRQQHLHRSPDRRQPPPRMAPPPRAGRPPRRRAARAARTTPGLLVRAARPVPRAQPLRGRRRRLRRQRRQLHPLVTTRAPWSSSSCTRSLRCSSRSFSFSRCTPTWAMRGGSGCAASA